MDTRSRATSSPIINLRWYLGAIAFLLICATRPAFAVVNGVDDADNRLEGVVFLYQSGCTGTYINPHFVLTAAHCVHRDGDGPYSQTLINAHDPFPIPPFTDSYVDYAYFATTADSQPRFDGSTFYPARAPDVALLRVTQTYYGKILPVLPRQDMPRPDNSFCTRFEFTWPTIAGFSDNEGTVEQLRRYGREFATCSFIYFTGDYDLGFVIDAHGSGIRTCQSDSGGPALWQTGFGGFAVGAIHSATETTPTWLLGSPCPEPSGSGIESFIPMSFLDRVAQTDPNCHGAATWEACNPGSDPYQGRRLRYLGTEIDQCGEGTLIVPTTGTQVTLGHGDIMSAEVGVNRFPWYCSTSQEWTTAASGTDFVVVKWSLSDRQITWDSYQQIVAAPSLLGYPQLDTAATRLAQLQLTLGTVTYAINSAPIGSIFAQSPPAGTDVPLHSRVNVTVSVGSVAVPSVLSLDRNAATSKLSAVGLGTSVSTQNSCIDPQNVIAQFPPYGNDTAPGSTVRITIDSGTRKSCVIK